MTDKEIDKEAIEVIEFYADAHNWEWGLRRAKDMIMSEFYEGEGGQKARDYLEKIKGEDV